MHYFLRLILFGSLIGSALSASEHNGQVTFNGLPVPGAAVTAVQGTSKVTTITDSQGQYLFSNLPDGTWTIELRMFGFAPERREIAIGGNFPVARWELKILPLDQIKAEIQRPVLSVSVQPPPPEDKEIKQPQQAQAKPRQQNTSPEDEDLNQRAADGLLINGSVNNGAASPFAQAAAFGNYRGFGRSLYNGGIGITFDNSALDARPFSLTGQNTPKAGYNRMTGLLTFGGPLRIPHLLKNGPNIFIGYQWTRNNNASTATAFMPDCAVRSGIFTTPVLDPLSGVPFTGNMIPQSRISPQARALVNLYPDPNFDSAAHYNYQVPIISPTHQDALQARFNKVLSRRDQINGRFAFQSTRSDTPNVFGFLDTTDLLGINAGLNWSHRFGQSLFLNLGVQYSRLSTRVKPFFEGRANVSGDAGIGGNSQDPANWGPPSLTFSSGVANLSDSQSSHDRNQTTGLSYSMLWNRRSHNITYGGDFRRQQFNYFSQQNPRGSFAFTGGITGNDFADFLLGIPDTVSLASGNADKYFRESVYDAYINDDWRVGPKLTINAGLRWEYGAPITELYGRLVNLDVASGFAAVSPVVAANPNGTLTAQRYPSSLVRPDKSGFEPRVAIAWRPFAASSTIVRAGYGVYYDTSVYQTIALAMAQQPPLSKSFSIQNTGPNLLTLADAFTATPALANTFAIDPKFRIGYAQTWQASIQRDLPGSLQLTASYLGIKGTRGVQEFLPNTYPLGTANPCPSCPIGFAYLVSNGNSTRESGQIQLRRRLHSGFAAMLQYTFSKSIDDDAALGGNFGSPAIASPNTQTLFPPIATATRPTSLAIAQDWRNLSAERSLSTFDQRHLLNLQMQYTTGMGLAGGTLLSGWKGGLFKDWTFSTQISAGSGLPQTPIYLAPVPGTGVTNALRPDYTGAPLYSAPSGLFLNPAAYTSARSGQWGNAGRNSITGPAQFTLNASLARTFRVSDRLNLDLRVDSTNALNHVAFTAWNTTVNSFQFGLPAAANAMRSLQTTLRLRF